MQTPTFVPSLVYRDPIAAIDWLTKAFGFELTMAIEGPDGDVNQGHWEMSSAGEGRVMIGGKWAEQWASPAELGGRFSQRVHVYVTTDIDAHCARARAAGATIVSEPTDQFYGDRSYRAADCEGHEWSFAQQIHEVTKAQAEAAIGQPIYATEWE